MSDELKDAVARVISTMPHHTDQNGNARIDVFRSDVQTLLSELSRLSKLVEEAEKKALGARSTLSAWFEIAAKTEEEIAPILLTGFKSYLRISKNGGMPAKDADTAYSVLADYIRLYAGRDLTPVVRHVASLTHKAISGGGE